MCTLKICSVIIGPYSMTNKTSNVERQTSPPKRGPPHPPPPPPPPPSGENNSKARSFERKRFGKELMRNSLFYNESM